MGYTRGACVDQEMVLGHKIKIIMSSFVRHSLAYISAREFVQHPMLIGALSLFKCFLGPRAYTIKVVKNFSGNIALSYWRWLIGCGSFTHHDNCQRDLSGACMRSTTTPAYVHVRAP